MNCYYAGSKSDVELASEVEPTPLQMARPCSITNYDGERERVETLNPEFKNNEVPAR